MCNRTHPIRPPFKSISLLTLFLLLSSSLLLGQKRGLHSVQASSFDFVLGGDFGFRLIQGNTTQPEVEQAINNRELYETYKLNYRIGFNYYQGISSQLLIKTGFRFANPGFSIQSVEPFEHEQDINTVEKKYVDFGSDYRYKYQVFEIPFGLRYVISKSFCNPYLELGVAPNFYWRTKVEERFHEGGSAATIINESINQINFIAFAGDWR